MKYLYKVFITVILIGAHTQVHALAPWIYVMSPPEVHPSTFCNTLLQAEVGNKPNSCQATSCGPFNGYVYCAYGDGWSNNQCTNESNELVGARVCVSPVCPEGMIPNPETAVCEYDPEACTEKAGQDAFFNSEAEEQPGYELLCYSGCAVEVSEYFQRTDNNKWVISYRYTGQGCGPGDPLGEPDQPPGTPPPETTTPQVELDTDGDGTPDHSDPDIDGDGIPNSEDTDTDGDGIPDDDDPTPWGQGPGEEQKEPSSAHTSDSCLQRPSCSGDAIQCAQLNEIWRLRCKSANETTEYDQSDVDNVLTKLDNEGSTLVDDWETEFIESLADDEEISFSESLKSKIDGLIPNYNCTDVTLSYAGYSGTITCAKTAPMRSVVAWILGICTALALFNIARTPVQS